MYRVIAKRRKELKAQSRITSIRRGVLPSATKIAMDDTENDRTEIISLDELKAQMDAIY